MAVQRPNIVLITTDQQSASTLASYGNTFSLTPNLSRLAREGVQCNSAFVPCPLCVPSRCSLMTGRYVNAHRSRGNTALLGVDELSLPDLLQQNGYEINLIGKNHCFRPDSFRHWDSVYEVDHMGPLDSSERQRVAHVEEARRKVYFEQAVASAAPDFPREDWGTAIIEREAVRLLEKKRERPFFLWLSFPDPHAPYIAPKSYRELYDIATIPLPPSEPGDFRGKPARQWVSWQMMETDRAMTDSVRELIATYYAMISFIDDAVGSVMRQLETAGYRDETLTIYMSDHGDYAGHHNMVRKSPSLYDSLVHVPLIYHWPGTIPDGRKLDELVSTVDIFPTIMEFLGMDIPSPVQGLGAKRWLIGEQREHREAVFSEVGGAGQPVSWEEAGEVVRRRKEEYRANPQCRTFPWIIPELSRGRGVMIRTHSWKLVQYANGDGELYDLRGDPEELSNLYRTESLEGIRVQLRNQLITWLVDRQDPRPPSGHDAGEAAKWMIRP